MIAPVRRLRAGARVVELWCDPVLDSEFLARLESAARAGPRSAGELELAGRAAFFKTYAFPGASRWRHLGRRALGGAAPCFQEARNLAWLAEQGFDAPEPLAAALVLERGLPTRQALASALVPDARALDRAVVESDERGRRELARTLGALTGRLHARGFVHRDLFLRNLLLDRERRLWLLDCRRGGRARPGRGFAYDLGAVFLDGAACFGPEDQRELLCAYFESRGACSRLIDRAALLESTARARRALRARLVRVDPARASAVPVEWCPPRL